jgi:hypothetical protein
VCPGPLQSAAGTYFLTYSEGQLSAWDMQGGRAGKTTLEGAGTDFRCGLRADCERCPAVCARMCVCPRMCVCVCV